MNQSLGIIEATWSARFFIKSVTHHRKITSVWQNHDQIMLSVALIETRNCFPVRLAIMKRLLQKNEGNESWRKPWQMQTRFCSFLSHNSPKEARGLARKKSKFPWSPKFMSASSSLYIILPKRTRKSLSLTPLLLSLLLAFFCPQAASGRPFYAGL